MTKTMAAFPDDGSPFDRIKQRRPDGTEIWTARHLQGLMGYAKWQNLMTAIARAMQAASNSGLNVASHFTETSKVVRRAQGGGTTQEDYELSRYAAYLVAMNGDPNKPEVKTYGADLTGSLITLFPVTDEVVIQTTWTMKEEKFLKLDVNPDVFPKEGTSVKLLIEVPEKK